MNDLFKKILKNKLGLPSNVSHEDGSILIFDMSNNRKCPMICVQEYVGQIINRCFQVGSNHWISHYLRDREKL
jgi:hypothetical protein